MNDHPTRLALSDLRDRCLDSADCLFDPELHDGPDPLTTIEHPDSRRVREDVARDVCATCPVRDTCLEYALRVQPKHGVWAGYTAEELTRLADLGEVA